MQVTETAPKKFAETSNKKSQAEDFFAKIDEAIADRKAGRGTRMTFEELEQFIKSERTV